MLYKILTNLKPLTIKEIIPNDEKSLITLI